MKAARTFLLWAALAVTVSLGALSVAGAFLGAARVKALFNSPPLVVFWLLLLALTAAAILLSHRVLREPGLVAMHLGVILVLIGGIWGSGARHELARRLSGSTKVPAGVVVVFEGGRSRDILDARLERTIGELPFELELRDFRIERYPPKDSRWLLVAEIPAPDAEPKLLQWEIGQETRIPGADASLTVLEYVEAARAVYPEGAVRDPESDVPAMRLSLRTAQGGSAEAWLSPPPGEDAAVLSVQDALGRPTGDAAAGVRLWLVRPPSPVKSYQSEVVVWAGGREAAHRVIEVNHPLHYGGYYVYQHSFDAAGGRYTVLRVTSDSGLSSAFAGFAMLCAGAFWHFWGRPGLRRLREVGTGGD